MPSLPKNVFTFPSKPRRARRSTSSATPLSEYTPQLDLPGTEPFDVIAQLTHDREKYQIADEKDGVNVTIYSLPESVYISIERLRARVVRSSKVSFSVIMTCCASHGINVLNQNTDIKELIEIKQDLWGCDNVTEIQDVEELTGWISTFSVGIPESSTYKGRKFCLVVPKWLKGAISGLSGELGVKDYILFIFAVMITLIQQNDILDGHREQMRDSVESFLRRVALRKRITDLLLEIIL